MQYSYVNQRMIRDKLIKHAIWHAYQKQLVGPQQPTFVLFLYVDPYQVDVNVHPAKHEVRFHQARLVHDFIYQAVVTVLQKSTILCLPIDKERTEQSTTENRLKSERNHFFRLTSEISSLWEAQQSDDNASEQTAAQLAAVTGTEECCAADGMGGEKEYDRWPAMRSGESTSLSQDSCSVVRRGQLQGWSDGYTDRDNNPQNFGKVLTLVSPYYALVELTSSLVLLSLQVAKRYLTEHQLTTDTKLLHAQLLLIPLCITLQDEEATALKRHQSLLQKMGIEIQMHLHQMILNAIHLPLRQQKLQNLIPDLLGYLHSTKSMTYQQVCNLAR